MSTEQFRDRILPVEPPARISRPQPKIWTWVIIGDHTERFTVVRHWDEASGATVPCTCAYPCRTQRYDYFVPALQLIDGGGTDRRTWEPVCLHLTDPTRREIITRLRLKNDVGDLGGVMVKLARQTHQSGRVIVHNVERRPAQANRYMKVAEVLRQRLRIGASQMQADGLAGGNDAEDGEPAAGDEQVIPPARSRSDKPRAPLGRKPSG